jgi:type 1 glutamine amidotransferase
MNIRFRVGAAPVIALILAGVGVSALPLAGQQPARSGAPPPGTVGPKEGGRGDTPLPERQPVVWAPGKTRVLMIGGGSSHPYNTVYHPLDTAILEAAGYTVNYTEDRDQAAAELGGADVAVLSVNRRYFDAPEYRQALMDFAARGKGIVLLHAGVWQMWPQWPEFYAQIVGGMARSHDRLAPFMVTVTKPAHPVMQGLPATFTVEDELYHMNAEPDETPAGTAAIDVLAETQPSARYMKPHPSIWVTAHPRARIVGIAIGHDQRVHVLPAFKTLLVNAVTWTAGK